MTVLRKGVLFAKGEKKQKRGIMCRLTREGLFLLGLPFLDSTEGRKVRILATQQT